MANRSPGLAVAAGLSILFLIGILGGVIVLVGNPPDRGPAPSGPTNPNPNPNDSTYNGVTLPEGATANGLSRAFVKEHNSFIGDNYKVKYHRGEDSPKLTKLYNVRTYVENNTFLTIKSLPSGREIVYSDSDTVYKSIGLVNISYKEIPRSEYDINENRVTIAKIIGSGNFTAKSSDSNSVLYTSHNKTSSADEILPGDGVSNYNASVVVSFEGYAPTMSVEYNTTMNNTQTRIRVTVSVTNIGRTTISEPDWVKEAR